MRCLWCSNPEGININGSLIANHNLLVDSVCPFGAVCKNQLDRSKCAECKSKECITKNKNLGIRLSYIEYDIDSIVSEVMQSSTLFFNGGGVTLTGGEPTIQFEAVKELLQKLKAAGINTTIETNASHPKLNTIFPLIDQLIMDFKHYDSNIHKSFTGIGNNIIIDNFEKAFQLHKNLHVRIPLVKGFNDSEKDIINFVHFFRQYKTKNASFEFLPYHEYGKEKWSQCGMNYQLKSGFIEPETLIIYKKAFLNSNLSVVET